MIRELVAQVDEAQHGFGAATHAAPTAAADEHVANELARARHELMQLVDEVRKRDVAIAQMRSAADQGAGELAAERAKTADLAREIARREATLQTASWRISELERLGADASTPDVDPDHAAICAERDALRRALTQEHEKVQRLERSAATVEDVAAMRARLVEREALVTQLSAELAARAGATP